MKQLKLKIAQDSWTKYAYTYTPSSRQNTLKSLLENFNKKHIPVYKADIKTSMEKYFASSPIWTSTAPVTTTFIWYSGIF